VPQVSAAQAAGGVTAFARPREQPRRVDLAELAELDAAMESGSEGDLEDDFLLTATQVCVMRGRLCSGFWPRINWDNAHWQHCGFPCSGR